MNILFMQTSQGEKCTLDKLEDAIKYIISFTSNTYEDLLYQLPDKQKQVLLAISIEGKAEKLTSGAFTKKYNLISPSSINSAVKGLLDKDLITFHKGIYQVYDKFFSLWINQKI